MRVRENAESIAFYNGEASEAKLLFQRLTAVVENFGHLLVTSRNLSFFTSFYRWPPLALYRCCGAMVHSTAALRPASSSICRTDKKCMLQKDPFSCLHSVCNPVLNQHLYCAFEPKILWGLVYSSFST